MAAIHQDDELNALRPAVVDQRVERCPRRPSRVEHIVHEQNRPVVDRELNLGAADLRLRPDGVAHQVIAIQRDVERAGRHLMAGDFLQRPGETLGDRHAARAHADERNVVHALVALDDLVSDAGERTADAIRIHYDGHADLSRRLLSGNARVGIDTSSRPLGTTFKETP